MPARPLARLAFGAGLLGLLAVAGCQKPLPEVSVTVGGKTVSAQPASYCFPGQSVQNHTCRGSNQATNEIKVATAPAIGIDVPPSVADKGWYVVVNNNRLNSAPLHKNYVRWTLGQASGLETGRLDFQVYQMAGGAAQVAGAWAFTLVVG